MDLCLMIEGQEGVSWDQWRALAAACEEHGVPALFRSDHYLSVMGAHDRGSLDAWGTVCALAAVTSRLRLGTLVSPASFRHPAVLAKLAVTADHVSGGRIEVGIGAGWLEAEHAAYGFPFPDARTRVDVFAEQLEIVHRSWKESRYSFDGKHYRVRDLDARPKPVQQPHPPLIVGGSGRRRSLELAARWADEYNTPFPTDDQARERRDAWRAAWERAGREPGAARFSVMTGLVVGADRSEFEERAARVGERTGRAASADGLPEAWVVGTVDQAIERLRGLADLGVDRVMLQHLVHEDLDVVALIGRQLTAALRA
jgi:F420-dependent oxidoreductase-like protein